MYEKFIKKSLLAVVVAALSLTLVKPVSVFALDIDSQANDIYLVAPKASKAVVDCVVNWDELDLGVTDLNELSLSNAIPAYRVVDGALNPLSVYYFPVLENEKVIAFSLAYEFNGEVLVQLTTALVAEVNDYIAAHSQVALIFDDMTIYATDGNSVEVLRTDKEELAFVNSRVISLPINVDCIPVECAIQLEYDPMSLDAPVYQHLDVPYKQNCG